VFLTREVDAIWYLERRKQPVFCINASEIRHGTVEV